VIGNWYFVLITEKKRNVSCSYSQSFACAKSRVGSASGIGWFRWWNCWMWKFSQ